MNRASISLLSLLFNVATAFTPNTYDECLRNSIPSISVMDRASSSYPSFTSQWNNRLPTIRPSVVVTPKTTAEVSKVIMCAKYYKANVVARGGGHSYEGYSLGSDSHTVIDLRYINSVKVDQGSKTAEVGGGALLGQIYYEAWTNGRLSLPAGTCPTVGIGGHATGGGFGRYSRTYGMVVDNILEMEVVTSDGYVRTVNNFQNKDLFWAIRGSGTGSFAIVTKFKFQLFQTPNLVTNFHFDFQVDENSYADVFDRIQKYSRDMPLEVGASLGLYTRSIGFSGVILADNQGQKDWIINHMIQNLPTPGWKAFTDTTFIDTVMEYSGLNTKDVNALRSVKRWDGFENYKFFKAKNGFIKEYFPREFLQRLGRQMTTAPQGTFILMDVQGGKPNRVPKEETAVVHRDGMLFDFQMIADAPNPDQGNRLMPWMDQTYDLLKPYIVGNYINYLDKDVTNWQQAYYGDHFNKLQQIKRKFDPNNLFNNPRSIPV